MERKLTLKNAEVKQLVHQAGEMQKALADRDKANQHHTKQVKDAEELTLKLRYSFPCHCTRAIPQ